MQNRAHRYLTRLVVVAAGAAALATTAACAGGAPDAREEQAQREAAREAQQEVRATPLETVIDAVREEVALTPAQEDELDAIADEAADEREGFRVLHEEIRRSAVDVVRAGTDDDAVRERAIADAVRAVDERVLQSFGSLEAVHAVLSPEQRAAVAENLRERLEEGLEARRQRRLERTKERREGGVARVASYLVLSPRQVEELSAIQKEMGAEKKTLRPAAEEIHALIDAFEGEDFGEALDALHEQKGRVLRARIARASDKADTALAILTAEQRALLADLILEGPSKLLLGEAAVDARE